MPLWVNRTVLSGASVDRNGTTSHTCTFTPASAGNMLIALIGGAVTSTTPAGWGVIQAAVNQSGCYGFIKTAVAGENSFTTVHNAANFPIEGVVYEYFAGTALLNAAESINNANNAVVASPLVNLLTGTFTRFGVTSQTLGAGTTTPPNTVWTIPEINDYDAATLDGGVSNGIAFSIGIDDGNVGASFTETAQLNTTDGNTHERIAFALSVTSPPSASGAPSVWFYERSKSSRRRRRITRRGEIYG